MDKVSQVHWRTSEVARPIQVVYLVFDVWTEMTLGGVTGWLLHPSSAWDVLNTAAAYEEMGALRCAEIIREVLSFFPGRVVPDDPQERASVTFFGLPPETDAAWDRLSDEILSWQEKVEDLLAAYIRAHAEAFREALRDRS